MADQHVDLSEDLSGSLVATCVSLLVLSWVAVGLRTYTRAVLMKSFMSDDWLMVIAQLLFTLACAMILEGARRGLGKHNAAVPSDDDRVAALMWQALATAVYILDMMFVKLSIGIFLLRLAVGRVYRYLLLASLIIVTLWSLGIFFWDVFQCTPVAKQWDFRIEEGHCASGADIISAAYALSVMTILSDWLYALLPIPMLWNVKMTKQAKATVIVILGLGVFASVATLVRLKFLSGLEEPEDLMYTATDAMIWTLVEPGVAIVASSLATIRPLLRAMRIKGFLSTDKTPSTGISGGGRSGYKNGSSRNTTGRRSMPGLGPNDVSLERVGKGEERRGDGYGASSEGQWRGGSHDGTSTHTHTHMHTHAVDGHDVEAARHSDSKSDMFVIEGGRHSSTWSAQELGAGSQSAEDLSHLEEQSQGLGVSTRR